MAIKTREAGFFPFRGSVVRAATTRRHLLASTALVLAGCLALAPSAWAADECGPIIDGSVTCIVPATSTAEDVLALRPDGIFLSNVRRVRVAASQAPTLNCILPAIYAIVEK